MKGVDNPYFGGGFFWYTKETMKLMVIIVGLALWLYPTSIDDIDVPDWCELGSYETIRGFHNEHDYATIFVKIKGERYIVFVPCLQLWSNNYPHATITP